MGILNKNTKPVKTNTVITKSNKTVKTTNTKKVTNATKNNKQVKVAKKKEKLTKEQKLNLKLFKAVKAENLKKIKALVKHGANVNALDKFGNTALLYVIRLTQNIEVINLLIELGANINIKNKNGFDALQNANKEYEFYLKWTNEVDAETEKKYKNMIKVLSNKDLAIVEGNNKEYIKQRIMQLKAETTALEEDLKKLEEKEKLEKTEDEELETK